LNMPIASDGYTNSRKRKIEATTAEIRKWCIEKQIKALRILNVFLCEPTKTSVIAAGLFPVGNGPKPTTAAPLTRHFYTHFANVVTGRAFEALVDVEDIDDVKLVKVEELEEGVQPALTMEELVSTEDAIRSDERVIQAAAEVGVKPEQIFADGWSIGWDERFPGKRVQQAICFARFGKDENLYAHPLDFMPVVDNITGKVIAIDYPAHRTGKGGKLNTNTTAPPTEANFEKPDSRERIPPPTARHEFLPELVKRVDSEKPLEMRTDLKPLHVLQPEGVSFKRDGNVLEWQKFKMHVAFHPREGIVLSAISYKDDDVPGATKATPQERPLFYRLSLAEMVVPYAEPAHPHYRKFAFDVGEYGLGYMANSLSLGCDCLGSIEYMDGHVAKHNGSVETIKNAICIHEEDAGCLWKHTDYVSARGVFPDKTNADI
jgi:primary-amine oxidase